MTDSNSTRNIFTTTDCFPVNASHMICYLYNETVAVYHVSNWGNSSASSRPKELSTDKISLLVLRNLIGLRLRTKGMGTCQKSIRRYSKDTHGIKWACRGLRVETSFSLRYRNFYSWIVRRNRFGHGSTKNCICGRNEHRSDNFQTWDGAELSTSEFLRFFFQYPSQYPDTTGMAFFFGETQRVSCSQKKLTVSVAPSITVDIDTTFESIVANVNGFRAVSKTTRPLNKSSGVRAEGSSAKASTFARRFYSESLRHCSLPLFHHLSICFYINIDIQIPVSIQDRLLMQWRQNRLPSGWLSRDTVCGQSGES